MKKIIELSIDEYEKITEEILLGLFDEKGRHGEEKEPTIAFAEGMIGVKLYAKLRNKLFKNDDESIEIIKTEE